MSPEFFHSSAELFRLYGRKILQKVVVMTYDDIYLSLLFGSAFENPFRYNGILGPEKVWPLLYPGSRSYRGPHRYTFVQWAQRVLFSVVFTPSPPSHHGSVWVLSVISLLLTNTISPVRACLIIWWERFRGTQREDDRDPLSIQSSLHLLQPGYPKLILGTKKKKKVTKS